MLMLPMPDQVSGLFRPRLGGRHNLERKERITEWLLNIELGVFTRWGVLGSFSSMQLSYGFVNSSSVGFYKLREGKLTARYG